jgi:hypothetical protein
MVSSPLIRSGHRNNLETVNVNTWEMGIPEMRSSRSIGGVLEISSTSSMFKNPHNLQPSKS